MIDIKTVSRATRLTAMLTAGAALMTMTDIANGKGHRRDDSGRRAQHTANSPAQSVMPAAGGTPSAQTNSNPAAGIRPVVTVSNGVITSNMFNGPGGLEVSANAPGTITVTNGSNSVTLPGNTVTLSGAVALAPGATPGVTVTPNAQGGYTVVRNTMCGRVVDTDVRDEIEGVGSRLTNKCPEIGDRFEDIANDFDR